jgi:hypothetical protein
MFDNQKPNNSPFGQPQNPFASSAQVKAGIKPVNNGDLKASENPEVATPISVVSGNNASVQPDDMFSGSEPVKSGPTAINQAPSQLSNFNQAPAVSSGPIFGSNEANYNQPEGPSGNYDEEIFGGRAMPWAKIITIGMMISAGLLVLVGVIFVLNYFLRSEEYGSLRNYNIPQRQVITEPVIEAVVPVTDDNIVTNETEINNETNGSETEIIDDRNRDSDGDGLTDWEEINVYRTDPLNPDTDSDGLTDWAEVMIYKTDPLNPDTDGDGYLDGYEVINNYDPLDPIPGARLWNVPGV